MSSNRPTKQQKRAAIRNLLIPIFLIIAAILYKPIKRQLGFLPKPTNTPNTVTAGTNGEKLTVDYIDVSQGDATLISKGDFHMLIDAGNNDKGKLVVDYLNKRGVKKLNILVGTHPDSDHIGGLDEVIKNISVEKVYMPDSTKQTKTYKDVLYALRMKKLKNEMPEPKKEYVFEKNVKVRFISPDMNYKDSNDNSIVVQLAYGKNKFLFMADAGIDIEKRLVSAGLDLESNVLKLGHHGSYSSTDEEFLKKVNPTYGVISCGQNNPYGHPHAVTLAKLEDEDVMTYRTDKNGTIVATSDGNRVTMSVSKD